MKLFRMHFSSSTLAVVVVDFQDCDVAQVSVSLNLALHSVERAFSPDEN